MARLTTFSKWVIASPFIALGIWGFITLVNSCNQSGNQQHYVQQQPTATVYAENDIVPDYNFSQAQARADFENGYNAGWNGYDLHSALYNYQFVFQPNFIEGWQQGYNDRINRHAWNSYLAFNGYWGNFIVHGPGWAWNNSYGYINTYVPVRYQTQIRTSVQSRQTSYESDLSAARQRVDNARAEQQRAQERVETARRNAEQAAQQQPKRTLEDAKKDMNRDFGVQDPNRHHGNRYNGENKQEPTSKVDDYGASKSPFGKPAAAPKSNDYGGGNSPFGKSAVTPKPNDYGASKSPFGGGSKVETPKTRISPPPAKPKGRY